MGTKKILNKDVSNVVEESLAGYLMAYRKYYKKVGEYNAFTYKGQDTVEQDLQMQLHVVMCAHLQTQS